MSNILFITPMWHEEATPHDAKVCNYFVDDWIKQGHKVVIVHYRSSFPSLYMKIAKMRSVRTLIGVLLCKVYECDADDMREQTIERYNLNEKTFDKYYKIIFGDEDARD